MRGTRVSTRAAVLAAGLVVVTMVACGHNDQQAGPPPPPEVGVVTIHARSVELNTELPGRTAAYRVAEVRPQVNGVIVKRRFKEGGDVVAGEALYQIDAAPFKAAYDSALATEAHARAALTSATLLLQRYQPLAVVNAVSKQDLDNAVASEKQAEADLASARASVETAHINLNYARVNAPISGRIGRSTVTEGALVTANQTQALAMIQQLDPIYVDVTQTSTLLLRLQRELASGRLKQAGKGKAEVRLVLEDGTPYDVPGSLQFTEVNVDQSTGSVTLRAEFPNPKHILLPGMFVRERISEGVAPSAILVPQAAVSHNQRGEATTIVVGPDDIAQMRTLKTDRAIGDEWLVTEGIHSGDRVIVEGSLRVQQPGMKVHASEMKPAAAGSANATAPAGSANTPAAAGSSHRPAAAQSSGGQSG